jgi:hypothetical protein
MKKVFMVFCLVLFVTGLAAAQVARGGTLYVAVRTVTLKSSTGFFASNRGTLDYGDRVTVLQVNGRFVEVRSMANATLTGWTPSANLSARQIVSGNTATVTARETALAGKGFNQEVEDAYRRQGNLNYADVDRIEAIRVSEADLRRFLEEGRLSMGDN